MHSFTQAKVYRETRGHQIAVFELNIARAPINVHSIDTFPPTKIIAVHTKPSESSTVWAKKP